MWSRREQRNLQATGKIKSGSKQLWKTAKKDWALNKLAKPVIQIKGSDPVAVYRSMVEAEIATGANHRNIALATKGLRKTVGGYRWELA